MEKYNKKLGGFGEKEVLNFLEQKGYKILNKNYSCRFGEIDIVALDKDCLVFVEVKTRTSNKFGTPSYAVNYWKQHHLKLSAKCYIEQYRMKEYFARFDIAEVFAKFADNVFKVEKINIIENAF